MTKPKFATPGQYQMWIDHITNIKVDPLPSEYDSEAWEDVPGEEDILSDDEIEDILDDESILDENSIAKLKMEVRKAKSVYDSFSKMKGIRHSDVEDLKKSLDKAKIELALASAGLDEETEIFVEAKGNDLSKGEVKIESDLIIAKNQYGKTKTWMWAEKEKTPRFKNNQSLWVKEIGREAKKWAKSMNEETIIEDKEYNFDPELKSISFSADGYSVSGLYNVEYIDLFYKIWINKGTDTVYTNDYGKEVHDNNQISDDEVDTYLDRLIEYAMDADASLHESFEILDEELINEGVMDFIKKLFGKSKSDTVIPKGGHRYTSKRDGESYTIKSLATGKSITIKEFNGYSISKILDELDEFTSSEENYKKYRDEIFDKIFHSQGITSGTEGGDLMDIFGDNRTFRKRGLHMVGRKSDELQFKIDDNKSDATHMDVKSSKGKFSLEFTKLKGSKSTKLDKFDNLSSEELKKKITSYIGGNFLAESGVPQATDAERQMKRIEKMGGKSVTLSGSKIKYVLDGEKKEVDIKRQTIKEDVAEEILSQLGGNKFLAMTGAKPWTKNKNNIAFKLPKNKSPATRLVITLNGKDLYNLDFGNQKSLDYRVIKTFKDIDAENLRKVFTDYTGMHTSLKEETLEENSNFSELAKARASVSGKEKAIKNTEYSLDMAKKNYDKAKFDHDKTSMFNSKVKIDRESGILKALRSLKEETLEEDISNITMLQNFKGNKATLKFKNGDSVEVASDEAKIIAKRYSELKGDLQKKFADMLNKNSTSFLLAYNDAMK